MNKRYYMAFVMTLVVLGVLVTACESVPAETPEVEQQAEEAEEVEEEAAAAVEEPEVEPTAEPEPTEVPRQVVLESLSGTVEVRTGLEEDFEAASAGLALEPGYEVRTGEDGEARLVLDDGTLVIVAANSVFVVTELEGTPASPVSRFFLNVGDVFAIHEGTLAAGASFEIETPEGVAAIRSSSMRVTRNLETGEIEVQCLMKLCTFTLDGQTFDLTDGEKITIPGGEIGPMSNEDFLAWLALLAAQGIEVEVVIPPFCGDGVRNQEGEACDGGDLGSCVVGCTGECACQPSCGDGWCGSWEDPAECPADCPAVCGDGVVSGGESCESRIDCDAGNPNAYKCTSCQCVLTEERPPENRHGEKKKCDPYDPYGGCYIEGEF